MANVTIGRYKNPKAMGWQGWIEPKDRSWIAFIDLKGRPVVYLSRDPKTGAVL